MRVSPVAVAAHTSIAAVGGASHTALIPSRTGCQPPRVTLAARAQAVTAVRLSAQPPADRSVQRLKQRHRWTAPAHGWAARPCLAPRRLDNALERTLRLASPPRPPGGAHGRHRRRCALPVPLLPATPQPPLGGSAT